MSDDPNSGVAPAPATLDIEKYAGLYIAIRDKKAALVEKHAEEMKPFNEGLAKIEGLVLPYLQATGQAGAKTKNGTFSVLDKYSASAEDPEAFRGYVVSSQDFDMVDMKPNVKNVQDYLKTHQTLPPGVKLNAIRTLGCRRPTKKAE